MPEAVMTYDTLVEDLKAYPDRQDAEYVAQIPRLVMLAENRIASEVRGLGLIRFVTAPFSVGNPTLVKPARWRQTISFNYEVSSRRVFLKLRTLEYCRRYWPQAASATRAPKYYADYDYEHFYFAPTPDVAYPFEIGYHERPLPLTTTNQESWTTRYAPQVLLFAALLEAAAFRKRFDEKASFQADYDRAASVLAKEDAKRKEDRARSADED